MTAHPEERSTAVPQIRFDDGAAYERMMGRWSRLVGEVFLDWIAPAAGLRWLDVGCGNGAFTELLAARSHPAEVQGIDPSPEQLAFARERRGLEAARFTLGEATALPFAADAFDAAVMALVIFFVPDPAKGVAEMTRVVRPGGTVSAYAWDVPGGGLPLEPIHEEMRRAGIAPLRPPRSEVSSRDGLRELWAGAGLEAVAIREIAVRRTFADFDDLWTSLLMGPGLVDRIAEMPRDAVDGVMARLRARLPADPDGRISYEARANAVRGSVPG